MPSSAPHAPVDGGKLPPALKVSGLAKNFGSQSVLRDISFEVPEGAVFGVIGGSGSGKSTLLRCLNLLIQPDAGEIAWYGQRFGWAERGGRWVRQKERALLPRRAEIGMVFQSYNLFPHMTALENIVEAPVTVRGRRRVEVVEEAKALLDKVRLSHRAQAYPHQMSGGEQQRVAIARALAMKPRAVLLDEVTSALDPELKGEVLNVVRLLSEEGMTMVIVSHEMGFMGQVADRVLFMSQGVIKEEGDAKQLLASPRTDELRAFLSRVDA